MPAPQTTLRRVCIAFGDHVRQTRRQSWPSARAQGSGPIDIGGSFGKNGFSEDAVVVRATALEHAARLLQDEAPHLPYRGGGPRARDKARDVHADDVVQRVLARLAAYWHWAGRPSEPCGALVNLGLTV